MDKHKQEAVGFQVSAIYIGDWLHYSAKYCPYRSRRQKLGILTGEKNIYIFRQIHFLLKFTTFRVDLTHRLVYLIW